MMYDFIRAVGFPARSRRTRLYRDVWFLPVCLGHLRLVETLFPDGISAPADHALLACLLALPPNVSLKAFARGRVPRRWWLRRVAPRTDEERVALCGYLRAAWQCPDRYRDTAERTRKTVANDREYASSPALRLMARVARIKGIGHLLAGRDLFDTPAQDAFAWIIADDELDGAHYMSAETVARFDKGALVEKR